MRDVNGKIIYYINITMAEEPKWRELKRYTDKENENEETDDDTDEDTDEEHDSIEQKIENVRIKQKGFSKLPHLENIYETSPPIIEGIRNKKKSKKSKSKKSKKNKSKKNKSKKNKSKSKSTNTSTNTNESGTYEEVFFCNTF